MAHELNSCRVKIQRAYENIQNLKIDIARLVKSGVYDVRRETDHQAGLYRYRASIKTDRADGSLMRLSAIAGEIIHQLRSALDHLVWQLVLKTGIDPKTLPRWKRIEFPVYISRNKYLTEGAAKVQATFKGAPEKIEQLQPYDRPDDPLWVLHEMNIEDKHRLLMVTATVAQLPAQTIGGVTLIGCPIQVGALHDGQNFLNIGIAEGHKDPKIRFEIVFDQIGLLRHQPVVKALTRLADFTAEIINAFDTEFFG